MATNKLSEMNETMKVDATVVSTNYCQIKDLANLKILFHVNQYRQFLLTNLGITINKCKKIIIFLLI